MTSKVNFHPSPEMLEGFAHGTLSPGLSVAVSAHVELCESCRERTSAMEAEATAAWLAEPEVKKTSKTKQPDYADMIASIVNQPQTREVVDGEDPVREIHMHEHSVTLPRALAKAASEGLVWRKMAGGINQATVFLDDRTQCEFLYMKPGSQVPVHKHGGNEITLVLDGSFSDQSGHYSASDFVMRKRNETHQPVSEEGCLCFAVLESPFTFTKGVSRLLNPFLRYRFRRATGYYANHA